MADHFVSLNRAQEGFQFNDFVTGTASSANVGLELRLGDSAGYRRVDVIKQLDAFKRFFENPALYNTAGFKVID
jgi:hypothetical protein